MIMLNAVSETAMNRTLLHFLALRSTLLLEKSIELFFFLLYGPTYVCTYVFIDKYNIYMTCMCPPMCTAIHIHSARYITMYCISEYYCSKISLLNITS